MTAALKTRLVWLLLALTLCQAWGAARHLHGLEPTRPDAELAWLHAGATASSPAQGAATPDAPAEDSSGEADCHCLWCSPRLHTVLAYALPIPEPPAGAPTPALLIAAPGFVPSPSPRGTVPPPRGPPA